jgi:hypothetical protein
MRLPFGKALFVCDTSIPPRTINVNAHTAVGAYFSPVDNWLRKKLVLEAARVCIYVPLSLSVLP